MSEIKYGLISKVDAYCLEKTMELIKQEFPQDSLEFLEVGLYAGSTGNGIKQYFNSIGMTSYWVGIDNNKDGQELIYKPDNLIIGNSNEVYNQIEDESQHLILIDALHTFPAVVSDFYCYSPKVKVGGYIAFHDTGKHLDPLSGWQGVGDKNDPDMCLGGVRKALQKIGLFNEWEPATAGGMLFELVFDEADPNDEGGGIAIWKKIY